MKDVNISLLSKLGWKLLSNQDCLWATLFKIKYVKYGNLLTSPLSSGSYIWNEIKSITPLFATGACFIPHVFSYLTVCSPWVPTLLGFKPQPRISAFSTYYPLAV
jgi:hypothetical protein